MVTHWLINGIYKARETDYGEFKANWRKICLFAGTRAHTSRAVNKHFLGY